MAGGLGISSRVAKTTIEEWARVVSEETEKHLPLIKLMRSRGRIKQGAASGGGMRWVPRVADHALTGFKDMTPIDYERVNTKENAFLPWRGYKMTDAISLREKLEQGGPEAMIKVFTNREEVMRRAAIRGLADKFYQDGNLAANVTNEEFHGIESFMAITAGQVDTDVLATALSDSYAGLSTARGQANFTGDPWSPVIVSTDVNPGAGVEAWASFADEYLRRGIIESTYGAGPGDMIDLITLTKSSYEDLLNLLDDKERLSVARGSAFGKSNLGFKGIAFDGVDVIWDAAVPSTSTNDAAVVRGYGWTIDQLELRLLNKGNLFTGRVTYNDIMASDHIFLYMVGNLKFVSPRHFVKFADIRTV